MMLEYFFCYFIMLFICLKKNKFKNKELEQMKHYVNGQTVCEYVLIWDVEWAISSFAHDMIFLTSVLTTESCIKLISIDSSFVLALISYHFFLNEAFDREN